MNTRIASIIRKNVLAVVSIFALMSTLLLTKSVVAQRLGQSNSMEPPVLTLTSDHSIICAGGWDSERQDYVYLRKEDSQVIQRDQVPDPHIATVTATLKDRNGTPLVNKAVVFSWDMPGPDPAQSKTVATNADGVATVNIVSGDEVSKDTDDETGQLLFNTPVPIKATYSASRATKNIDIVAPTLTWQYKDESGNYVDWDGEVYGLYPNTFQKRDIPLRVLVKFDNQPIAGHKISWDIDKILDKAGEEVASSASEYPTYGTMSGPISTTTMDGGATATFTLGYNFGQIVFSIADGSVYTSH